MLTIKTVLKAMNGVHPGANLSTIMGEGRKGAFKVVGYKIGHEKCSAYHEVELYRLNDFTLDQWVNAYTSFVKKYLVA